MPVCTVPKIQQRPNISQTKSTGSTKGNEIDFIMQAQSCTASLSLRIATSIPAPVLSIISYNFKVFAAIYGYQVLEEDKFEKATILCFYGKNADESQNPNVLYIPARYTESPWEQPDPTPRLCTYADQEIYLFYGVNE